MKIAVIGQGYVGLPLALSLAGAGHYVVGFDTNRVKIQELLAGKSYIDDVNSEVLKLFVDSGHYLPTFDPTDIANVEVAIIAVPTPLNSSKEPDLSYLESACDLLGEILINGTLIINESTSYPGTLRKIISARIEAKTKLNGKHLYAVSPERVDPGNSSFSIKNTPRLIAGLTYEATKAAHQIYQSICEKVIIVSSPEIAEAAKIFENTFRQVNIALVNEFSTIMQAMDISTREVLEASASKPYGFMKFEPGIGVGGHCIPVDPIYLAFISEKFGISSKFINLATQVNAQMPEVIAEILERKIGQKLNGKKILVLGITYKPDIADVRESPSIELIRTLRERGCEVVWNDPIVTLWENESSTPLTKSDFDATLIAVAHKSFEVEKILLTSKLVLDATGKYLKVKQLI